MALTIRAAIDEGAQAFDLLWGTEGYKSLWARDARTLRRIQLFPPHAAGRIHRRAVEARRRLGRLARRVLTPGEHPCTPHIARAGAGTSRRRSPRRSARAHDYGFAAGAGARARSGRSSSAITASSTTSPSVARTEMPSMLTSTRMFERHLDCIGRHFRFVSLDEIGAHVAERRAVRPAGGRRSPSTTAITTTTSTRFRC